MHIPKFNNYPVSSSSVTYAKAFASSTTLNTAFISSFSEMVFMSITSMPYSTASRVPKTKGSHIFVVTISGHPWNLPFSGKRLGNSAISWRNSNLLPSSRTSVSLNVSHLIWWMNGRARLMMISLIIVGGSTHFFEIGIKSFWVQTFNSKYPVNFSGKIRVEHLNNSKVRNIFK